MNPTPARRWLFALTTGLLVPALAQAYSVGKLQVSSRLGEPLRAQVLISGLSNEAQSLLAEPASASDLAQLGLQASAANGTLRIERRPAGPGQVLLLIASEQPVHDPYVDVVVRLRSRSARAPQVQHLVALVNPPDTAPVLIVEPADQAPPMPAPPSTPVLVDGLASAERPLLVSNMPPPDLPAVDDHQASVATALPDQDATMTPAPEQVASTATSPQISLAESVGLDSPSDAQTTTPERVDPARPPVASLVTTAPWPSEAATAATPTTASLARTAVAKPAPPAAPKKTTTAQTAVASGRYTVRRNDSLWGIARRLQRPLGQPADRIAQQLRQLNPQAFNRRDHLIQGTQLVLPKADDSRAQAQASTNRATKASRRITVSRMGAQRRLARPQTRLSVVAPTTAGLAAGNAERSGRRRGPQPLSRELSGQANLLRQETASLRREVLELDAQVNLNDQKIAMQNARLAELQQRLKARKSNRKNTASAIKSAPMMVVGTALLALAGMVSEPAHADGVVNATNAAAAGSGGMWPLLLAALALAALAAFFLLRKKKDDPRARARSRVTSNRPAARPGAQPAPTTKPAPAPAPQPAPAPAPTPKTAPAPVAQDPLAEARAFVAQERIPQAVGVLNRGLNTEPGRSDLMLMLLDIYLLQNDVEAFDSTFARLQAVATPEELDQAQRLQNRLQRPKAANPSGEALEFNRVAPAPLATPEPAPISTTPDTGLDFVPVARDQASSAADNSLDFAPSAPAAQPAEAMSLDDLEAELNASLVQSPPARDSSLDFVASPAVTRPEATPAPQDLAFTLEPSEVQPNAAALDLADDLSLAPPVQQSSANAPVDLQFDLDDDFDLDSAKGGQSLKQSWAGELASQEFKLPHEAQTNARLPEVDMALLAEATAPSGQNLQDQMAAFDATLSAPDALHPVSVDPANADGLAEHGPLAREFAFVEQIDAQALNLDLARQYAGMGEIEGAHELLDEVIARGTAQQQEQARQIKAQFMH